MAFDELTPNAGNLLQEILDHRFQDGICDSDYWRQKFEDVDLAEDIKLRSLFKELREKEMISVDWADDYPYSLSLLNKGLSYKDSKQKYEKEKRMLSHREWCIAIASAIIGALIGQIPTIIQWLGGI